MELSTDKFETFKTTFLAILCQRLTLSFSSSFSRSLLRTLETSNLASLEVTLLEEVKKFLDYSSPLRRFLTNRNLEEGELAKVAPTAEDRDVTAIRDGQPEPHINQREVYLQEYYLSEEFTFNMREICQLKPEDIKAKIEQVQEKLLKKEASTLNSLLPEPKIRFKELNEDLLLRMTQQKEGKLFMSQTLWDSLVSSNLSSL